VSAITAEAQAAVRQMVADARAAASTITAEAQRSAVSAIASIHQSVTGAVADMRQSVTNAVSETAHQIGADFAAHVNTELTTMTADFKQSHPAVAQATTDVVGYIDAVSTTATAVQNAAAQLKEVPSAVREMRTALKETLTEAGRLGQDFQRGFGVVRQGATSAAEGVGRFATASRGAATAVGGAVRNLAQLAAGMTKAAVQTAIATVRTVAMAVAQRVVAVATRLWAAMQALLNIVMRLNPLGLIITGITLLVGLFVLAYQRSATFRAIVQGAMRGVQVAISWVGDAARADALDFAGEGSNPLGGGAAAAADDIDPAVAGKLAEDPGRPFTADAPEAAHASSRPTMRPISYSDCAARGYTFTVTG